MSDLIIREPVETDIHALQPVFRQWIRDRGTGAFLLSEAEGIKDAIRDSIAGEGEQQYLVAEQAGKVLGIMGIQPPERGMKKFATTERPVELITALVSARARGQGVGKALVNGLTEKAVAEGATELIVNSGPRYRASGWPFWNRLFGKPIGTAHGYYGLGGDAKVWQKPLIKDNLLAVVRAAGDNLPQEEGQGDGTRAVLDALAAIIPTAKDRYFAKVGDFLAAPSQKPGSADELAIIPKQLSRPTVVLSVPTEPHVFEDYAIDETGVSKNSLVPPGQATILNEAENVVLAERLREFIEAK